MEQEITSRTEETKPSTSPRVTQKQAQLEYLKQFHDEAYLYVSQGLALEESNEGKAALMLYERGLRLIDQALSIQTNETYCTGSAWDEARKMQTKMRRTRLEILERLANIVHTVPTNVLSSSNLPSESPPSYEEATRSQWQGKSISDSSKTTKLQMQGTNTALSDKVVALNETMDDSMRVDMTELPANAEELFSLPDVQIFFVSPDGYVSAPSYPTSLKLYKFNETVAASNQQQRAPAFLQVGSWMYPLIPGQSPVLQSNYGAYMFPDTSTHQAGAAVGLIFPDDVDEDVRAVFESILCEFTLLRSEGAAISPDEVAAEKARLSRRISDGIVKGAELLARGVEFSAEKTSYLVHCGARKLRQKIKPSTCPAQVDPRVGQGLRVAKEVSGVAVSISGFVVRKVGEATMSLGRYLAPQVRKHGSVLLSRAMNEDSSKANKKIDDILEVAAGSMRGVATMYVSLESAARMLASSLTNETVQLVNYKYGEIAGDATDSALHAVGNLTLTAYNVNALGIKGIAKRTAKNTGKALVEDYENKTKQPDPNTTKSPEPLKEPMPKDRNPDKKSNSDEEDEVDGVVSTKYVKKWDM